MLTVILIGGVLRSAARGQNSIQAEGGTIQELMLDIERQYPEMRKLSETNQISVSIDGNIFRDNWQEVIPENAEIYLLPRIAGG